MFLNNVAHGNTSGGSSDSLVFMAINYAMGNSTYLDLKVQQAD